MSRWFRFYDDALNDPKVQSLPPALFKAWVNLLCLASKNDGRLPPVADVAFALRVKNEAAAKVLHLLCDAGLVDTIDGDSVLEPHNWSQRQFKSDNSTARVQEHRKLKRFSNVSPAVTETPPEQNRTDTESEAEREAPTLRSGVAHKGTRLPDDFSLSEAEIEFAASHGYAGDPLAALFSDFRDYWHARAGPQAVKRDWPATWRRWVRTESKPKGNGYARQNSGAANRKDRWDATLARLATAADEFGSSEARPSAPRLLSFRRG
jgi:hypothetical protein